MTKRIRTKCTEFNNTMIRPSWRGTYYKRDHYVPIFTYPSETITTLESWDHLIDLGLQTVIPKSVDIEKRYGFLNMSDKNWKLWVEMSVEEFCEYVKEMKARSKYDPSLSSSEAIDHKICVKDNAHTNKLQSICKEALYYIKGLTLAIGNIMDPDVISSYSSIGVQYIILGNPTDIECGIGYPLLDLLKASKKYEHRKSTKFILDFWPSNNVDIILAIACGADYVMLKEPLEESFFLGRDYYYHSSSNGYSSLMHGDCKKILEDGMVSKPYTEFGSLYETYAHVRVNNGVYWKEDHKWNPVVTVLKKWIEELEGDLIEAVEVSGNSTINRFKTFAQVIHYDK